MKKHTLSKRNRCLPISMFLKSMAYTTGSYTKGKLHYIYFFNKQKIVLATHFLIKKIICTFKSVIMMSKSQIHISHPHELTWQNSKQRRTKSDSIKQCCVKNNKHIQNI